MAHSDRGWTCGCAGKTMRSLENMIVPYLSASEVIFMKKHWAYIVWRDGPLNNNQPLPYHGHMSYNTRQNLCLTVFGCRVDILFNVSVKIFSRCDGEQRERERSLFLMINLAAHRGRHVHNARVFSYVVNPTDHQWRYRVWLFLC